MPTPGYEARFTRFYRADYKAGQYKCCGSKAGLFETERGTAENANSPGRRTGLRENHWQVVGENARGFVPSDNPGTTLLKVARKMKPLPLAILRPPFRALGCHDVRSKSSLDQSDQRRLYGEQGRHVPF